MTVVEEAITKVLEEKSLAFPRTVTVAVSSVAAFLVVTNIVLIVCVLHRRRQVNSNSSQGEIFLYLGLLVFFCFKKQWNQFGNAGSSASAYLRINFGIFGVWCSSVAHSSRY